MWELVHSRHSKMFDLNVVSFSAVLLKAAAQKAHQVKTAINLKPLPNIAPQDEFAYHQFRDMKLKGRHFEVELVTI